MPLVQTSPTTQRHLLGKQRLQDVGLLWCTELPVAALKSAFNAVSASSYKMGGVCQCGIVLRWSRGSSHIYGDSHIQTFPFVTWHHPSSTQTFQPINHCWGHWWWRRPVTIRLGPMFVEPFPVQMHYECRWSLEVRCWSMMSFVKCEFFSKSKGFNIHDIQYMMIIRIL